jgi:hypothetical protein
MAEQHHHLFHHNKDGENPVDYKEEEKHNKHLEELGGLGGATAGTYALVISFF